MSKEKKAGKKGSKIKIIVIIAVLALIAAFIVMMISSASMMSGMTMAETFPLEKKTIENKVSVSGIVESQNFKQVASNLTYNVESVNVEVGDTLAVLSTGAYNYSMASNYNRIPRPAMVMVKDGKSRVIIKRESYEDLVRNDI